ncbi:hypothetical protein BDA96_04G119100 [Sorghum bicolor]|uniref:Myb/SANT-like domain-containing protein n=1 Tax=Sorghum bicolor TaxID=4558 RepID=A0A921R3A3_SORBI|nr:hypothetical protein BDA96_04G119100 [Sorghum bicolor]
MHWMPGGSGGAISSPGWYGYSGVPFGQDGSGGRGSGAPFIPSGSGGRGSTGGGANARKARPRAARAGREDNPDQQQFFPGMDGFRYPVLKHKGSWDPKRLRVFIDIYHSQIKNGNYNNGVMSSAGWKDIKHKYFLATGLVHEREQFNSKVQELKAEWRLCNSLRKSSGLGGSGYNVYADDDWWEKESKGKKALLKIRDGGMPDYLGQLDDMFAGWTVDGSTAYRPGTGAATNVIGVEDSDDEDAQHEVPADGATPASQGLATPGSQGFATPASQGFPTPSSQVHKRPSSTNSTASSPSKKTRSSNARSWDSNQREANDIERQKVNLFGTILELQQKKNQHQAQQSPNQHQTKKQMIEQAYNIAAGMGITAATRSSFLAVRKICRDEVDLAIFLSCTDDAARWIIIQENLPVEN